MKDPEVAFGFVVLETSSPWVRVEAHSLRYRYPLSQTERANKPKQYP